MKKIKKDNKVNKWSDDVKLKFEMDQKVYFYLTNSVKILEGKIIGFFALVGRAVDDNEKVYTYQIEYYQKQKDGSSRMYIGNVTNDAKPEHSGISANRDSLEKIFVSVSDKRIKTVIKNGEIELAGAVANMDHHKEAVKEMTGELKRLRGLLKSVSGKKVK